MKALVTGGAGFIGSHLVNSLMAAGSEVTVVDGLFSGKKEFLKPHFANKRFKFVKADLRKPGVLDNHVAGTDVVFHMAAAVEVRRSAENSADTFGHNITATYNMLESVRKAGTKSLVFSSSGTVFGDAKKIPTPEDYGPLKPISFYGASKVACEAMISSYSGLYGFNATVFRFANIIGPHGTHGVIRDFILKLRATPKRLEILGNGKQDKSYLHVTDCVAALRTYPKAQKPFDVLHVGSEGSTNVDEIARIIVEEMGLSGVKFAYTGGKRGWPGDVVRSQLDVHKLKGLGWKPHSTSSGAVRRAVKELLKEV